MIRLTSRVYLVGSGRNGFGISDPYDGHVYLVDGGTESALIDSGAGVNLEPLLARVNELGPVGRRLSLILVTHAHADHAGGVAGLQDALGARAMASPEVARIIQEGDEHGAGVDVAKKWGVYEATYRLRPAVVDQVLSDGDLVCVGDVSIQAIATPGHSTGHLSFLARYENRVDLFSGDALLFGGLMILQDTWDCNLSECVSSIRKLGDCPHDALFPGHFTLSVTDGSRHVRIALEALNQGKLPPIL